MATRLPEEVLSTVNINLEGTVTIVFDDETCGDIPAILHDVKEIIVSKKDLRNIKLTINQDPVVISIPDKPEGLIIKKLGGVLEPGNVSDTEIELR